MPSRVCSQIVPSALSSKRSFISSWLTILYSILSYSSTWFSLVFINVNFLRRRFTPSFSMFISSLWEYGESTFIAITRSSQIPCIAVSGTPSLYLAHVVSIFFNITFLLGPSFKDVIQASKCFKTQLV